MSGSNRNVNVDLNFQNTQEYEYYAAILQNPLESHQFPNTFENAETQEDFGSNQEPYSQSAHTTNSSPAQTSTPATVSTKPPRQKKGVTSKVWNYFTKQTVVDSSGVETVRAFCNICRKSYACMHTGGTSHLLRHYDAHQKNDPKQTTLNLSASSSSLTSFSYSPETMRKALARFVITEELPLSHGESENLEIFSQTALNPAFRKVSRYNVRKDCMNLFYELKAGVHQIFLNLDSRVAFTSDIWTTKWGCSYICLTSHFVDHDFILHQRIIGFKLIESKHTGLFISNTVMAIIRDYDIAEKVVSFTFDNASNNTAAVNHLTRIINPEVNGLIFHQRCACHIINLIVQDGLSTANVFLEKPRDLMFYIHTHSNCKRDYRNICRSNGLPYRAFRFSMPTRWNSTYEMMKCMLDNKVQLGMYAITYASGEEFDISEYEWKIISELYEFFEVFYFATNRLSGVYYPTSVLALEQIVLISEVVKKHRDNENLNADIRIMVDCMSRKIVKYWNPVPILYCVAKVFDPRVKEEGVLALLETYYENMNIEGDQHIQSFKSSLRQLFTSYESRLGRSVQTTTMETPSNSGSKLRALYAKKKQRATTSDSQSSELTMYLATNWPFNDEDFDNESYDCLSWWKQYKNSHPILSMMARDLLAIQVSSVASESAFSAGSRVLSSKRSRLKDDMVEASICAKDWFKAERRTQNIGSLAEDSDDEEDAADA